MVIEASVFPISDSSLKICVLRARWSVQLTTGISKGKTLQSVAPGLHRTIDTTQMLNRRFGCRHRVEVHIYDSQVCVLLS
jgi:hypothetical protein